MLENVGQSIPEATGCWSQCKALYRLLERDEITWDSLIQTHGTNSIRRVARRGEQVVLNVQDTSSLNFQTHSKLEGQGPIGSSKKATGFHLHATALVGADSGIFHGILGAKIYARDAQKRSKQTKGTRNRERIEDKESYRWIESMKMSIDCRESLQGIARKEEKAAPQVVNVGDREADIYELLCEAQNHKEQGVHLLVRSKHNRKLEAPEDGQSKLWDTLAKQKKCGKVTIRVPRSKGIREREAVCEIRFKKLTLAVPAHKEKYLGAEQTITLTAIELVEIEREGKEESKAIHWKLLTTWPVESLEEARRMVRWYANRWNIEVFFRVLKTGCRVERRQFGSIATLWPMIVLDLITAGYVMGLTSTAQAQPLVLASDFFSIGSLEALGAFYGEKKEKMAKINLQDAVKMVSRLGGHLGRKGDGPPGAEVLWRGTTKLTHITEAWEIFESRQRCG